MLIVGLTGGIATGKSTASKLLATHHDIQIVDADIIARQVVEPGTRAYQKIVSHFSGLTVNGDKLVQDDGSLNRPALGRIVFGNEKERKYLNSIVHPAVRFEMARQVFWAWITGQHIVVLDVPLLFESKLDRFCALSVSVLCKPEVEMDRLMNRDGHLSKQEAENRIASQMSLEDKRKRADIVIDNDGTIDELKDKIHTLVAKLQPNTLLYLIEWIIPPVGLSVALYTFVYKYCTKYRFY